MRLEELINKKYNQLHENDLYIIRYVLSNKNTCYRLGINELAGKCNVSRSSILRLAQKLGFSGYSEFRVYLKWQDEEQTEQKGSSIERLNEDILETLKFMKTKDFRAICERIDGSARIFVYGTGSLQLNCAEELQRLFIPVDLHLNVIRAMHEFKVVLENLTDRDMVIIVSLSGDTPMLLPIVQTLNAQGVPLLSITNFKNNKLATMATYNLYASSSEVRLKDNIETTASSSFFIMAEVLFRHYIEYRFNQNPHL